MLLLAVWMGAALDQSFDRFKVTGTSGFNELIISGQIGHGLFLNMSQQAQGGGGLHGTLATDARAFSDQKM